MFGICEVTMPWTMAHDLHHVASYAQQIGCSLNGTVTKVPSQEFSSTAVCPDLDLAVTRPNFYAKFLKSSAFPKPI